MTNASHYTFPIYNYIDLPKYAAFIKLHKLSDFVNYQIQLARELEVPLFSYLKHLNEEEIVKIYTHANEELLTFLSDNDVTGLIKNTMSKWVNDELPVINRDSINTADITLFNHIRKKALVKLIHQYTTETSSIMNIISEIDQYILELQTSSFQTYIDLLNCRIREHAHFIETITQTSPGIVYVFDLLSRKQVYSNNKLQTLLGYTPNDLPNMGVSIMGELMHEVDVPKASEHLKSFSDANDGEVRSLTYRLKNNEGDYIWIKSYESVFKRSVDGKPEQIIGIALDVDIEKRATDELRLREEQLLEAQEMAQTGSYCRDLIRKTSTVTPQFEKIFGVTATNSVRSFTNKIHPSDKPVVKKAIERALLETGNYDVEFRYEDSGTEKVIWSRGKVLYESNQPVTMKGTVVDVTDRHHMIKLLQRNDELFKQAQALTHIGNWTWSVKEDRVDWSDELYKIHEMEPQSEVMDFDKVMQLIHPEEREVIAKKVMASVENREGYDIHYRILINGKTKYLQGKGEALLDENGETYKLFGTAQDLTAQYETQSQLAEHEKFLQKITDFAPSIIAAYNIHTGDYSFISKAVSSILGYSKADFLSGGNAFFIRLIHPDDIAIVEEKTASLLATSNLPAHAERKDFIVEFTCRMMHLNGHYHWLQTFGTVLDRDTDGKVEEVLYISVDVTDKVHADQKINEQEHFIKHIADASPTILYVYDLKLKMIVYINQEIYTMLGYIPEEITEMGEDFSNTIFHPDEIEKIDEIHNKLIGTSDTSSMIEYEAKMKHKKEGYRDVLLKEIVFKRDYQGEVWQVLCAALDITERKEMEKALYDKTMELHQSNTSLAEFAYVASHDLKEPLRKISAFGDRLIASQLEKLDDNGKFYLDRIIDSSKRMNVMIDDLLSLSMISSQRLFENYSLQSILNEVLLTLEFRIEKLKAVIEADSLPMATIVPSQFRQMFQNLISNSLKFMPVGVQPHIQIECAKLKPKDVAKLNIAAAPQYIQLKFIDNGIGFGNENADKIFVVFQRLHGRSEYEGTGIGLAICKRIMENHGGAITATGQTGKGATFTLTLPLIGKI